jgi:GMP synthase-like glutamine amidotransferase
MAVLVFRHAASEPVGYLGDVLTQRGIEWRYVDLWEDDLLEDGQETNLPVENAQGVAVMGGAMSVNDSLPWLRHEERYIVRAISSGVPVLGVCLGAQLLAKCLGARVSAMGHKEIGWHPVKFTAAGLQDGLLGGLQQEETLFHWHGDTFDLPRDAVKLAESRLCANQAFRHGENLYGVQFHPEVTPEIIQSWCTEDASCGGLREVTEPVDPFAHGERAKAVASQIFGRWCDLVATR